MMAFRPLGVLMCAATRRFKSVSTNDPCNLLGKRHFVTFDNDRKFVSHKDFDVVLTDIDEKELFDIGVDNNVEHLSPASFLLPPFPVKGRIHGRNIRLMVPLVCKYSGSSKSRAYNVWFLLDSGAPDTFLSVKSLETLVGQELTRDLHTLYIQDQAIKIECWTSHGHFTDVNVLGMNVMQKIGLTIDLDWAEETFILRKQ